MPDQPSAYRRTLFDRHGAAAADLIRSWMYGAMVFALAFGAAALASPRLSLLVVIVAAVAGIGTNMAALWIGSAAGGVAKAFTQGTGSTPHEEQYSYQQALAMQGRIDEAIASFESFFATEPGLVQPRVRAAELYIQHKGDHRRAAELLREALRSPALRSGEDVYITNRLVDLLTGPLAEPGRACVELRRLIDCYPGSATATRARDALSRIKETLNPQ